MCALDAFEERIVLGLTCCSTLIGVMLEDLLAVCFLDLFVGGTEAVLGETEDSVVILSLRKVSVRVEQGGVGGRLTFQSLASRCSMRGSSGSLISPSSSSSVFLTLARAWMRSSSENVRP